MWGWGHCYKSFVRWILLQTYDYEYSWKWLTTVMVANDSKTHRRTSQGQGGLGGCSPPHSGKTIIFRAEASSQKWRKKHFLYLLNEKHTIYSVERDKVPEIRDFLLIITGWGESRKVILQVSIAVFRALSTNFSCKDGSAPLWRTPMAKPKLR